MNIFEVKYNEEKGIFELHDDLGNIIDGGETVYQKNNNRKKDYIDYIIRLNSMLLSNSEIRVNITTIWELVSEENYSLDMAITKNILFKIKENVQKEISAKFNFTNKSSENLASCIVTMQLIAPIFSHTDFCNHYEYLLFLFDFSVKHNRVVNLINKCMMRNIFRVIKDKPYEFLLTKTYILTTLKYQTINSLIRNYKVDKGNDILKLLNVIIDSHSKYIILRKEKTKDEK